MKLQGKKFGGDCPKFTTQPVQVGGGFTLNAAQATKFAEGWLIPEGSLANVDESTREAVVVVTGRVTAIDATDSKKVTLQADGAAAPPFCVNDYIGKDLTATLANTPKVTAVELTNDGLVVTLSKAITGLAVGDTLCEVVADGSNVKLLAQPNSVLITDEEVKADGDTCIDVTRNTGNGECYARRVPPVPATLMEGNILKGTKVAYTNTL